MTVRWSDETQHEMWFWATTALAGLVQRVAQDVGRTWAREEVHDEAWAPATLAEAHPASYDPAARSELMTEWGVQIAVLYPNAAGFAARAVLERSRSRDLVGHDRAYNTFLDEWVGGDPGRYIPSWLFRTGASSTW